QSGFRPGGKTLVVGDESQGLRLWYATPKGPAEGQRLGLGGAPLVSIAVDGRRVVTQSELEQKPVRHVLKLWDTSGQLPRELARLTLPRPVELAAVGDTPMAGVLVRAHGGF